MFEFWEVLARTHTLSKNEICSAVNQYSIHVIQSTGSWGRRQNGAVGEVRRCSAMMQVCACCTCSLLRAIKLLATALHPPTSYIYKLIWPRFTAFIFTAYTSVPDKVFLTFERRNNAKKSRTREQYQHLKGLKTTWWRPTVIMLHVNLTYQGLRKFVLECIWLYSKTICMFSTQPKCNTVVLHGCNKNQKLQIVTTIMRGEGSSTIFWFMIMFNHTFFWGFCLFVLVFSDLFFWLTCSGSSVKISTGLLYKYNASQPGTFIYS